MKASKTEQHFKATLENRRITPSSKTWEQLDENLTHKKGSKLFYIQTAAVVLILIGCVAFFIQFSSNTLQSIPLDEKVVFEKTQPIQPVATPPSITKEIITDPFPKQFVLNPPTKRKLVPFEQQFKQAIVVTDFSKIKLPEIIIKNPEFALPNDSLIDLEADQLIIMAMAVLRKNKSETARQKEQALTLLLEIEDELISETFLKNRVFDILKSSYSKVKVAANESNTTNPKQ